MPDLWTTVGVLLSALSFGCAYYWYTRQKSVRRITCTFRHPAILDLGRELIKGSARHKLMVVFGDKHIDQLTLLQARQKKSWVEPGSGSLPSE